MTGSAQAIASREQLHTPPRRVLHEATDLRYLRASDVPSDAIVRLLSESFCREPMAVALGTSVNDLAALIARFMPECKGNGLSVVAVTEDEPETVVAAFLSRDFKSPM